MIQRFVANLFLRIVIGYIIYSQSKGETAPGRVKRPRGYRGDRDAGVFNRGEAGEDEAAWDVSRNA